MNHCVHHFHTGRVTIDKDAADLLFQQPGQFAEVLHVIAIDQERRGQLTMQAEQGFGKLRLIGDFDQDRGRPEDFFLQQFIAIEQQADIGLE